MLFGVGILSAGEAENERSIASVERWTLLSIKERKDDLKMRIAKVLVYWCGKMDEIKYFEYD